MMQLHTHTQIINIPDTCFMLRLTCQRKLCTQADPYFFMLLNVPFTAAPQKRAYVAVQFLYLQKVNLFYLFLFHSSESSANHQATAVGRAALPGQVEGGRERQTLHHRVRSDRRASANVSKNIQA
jgi:hypothetical protein